MSPNATPATVSRDPKSLPPTATVNTPPTTPTTLSTTAHTFHAEIIQIHDDLLKISDLAPSEQTNRLLARLVTLCIAPHDVALSTYFFSIPGTQKLCISLRGICANAEAELENYWAERVLSDSKASGTSVSPAQCPSNMMRKGSKPHLTRCHQNTNRTPTIPLLHELH